MNELLGFVQQLMQYIEANAGTLNQETQRELAVFLQEVWQFIEQQQQQQNPAEGLPPNPPQQPPQLDQGAFPSSNVNSYKYDPTTERLFVKFHGAESAEGGPTYLYQGVPRNIYDVFARGGVAPTTSGQNRYHRWIRGVTPSLGAALYHLIRQGGYPYQRVSG